MRGEKAVDFTEGYRTSGYCWDVQTKARFDDPLFLESYGYKVYSQNDEDGIIAEIFKRIGTTDKRFIEFGVWDGLETNTHYLLFKGWSGLWVDSESEMVKAAECKFRPVINNGQLKIVNAFVHKENINPLLSENEFIGEIDLLSINIAGNDYHIWKEIEVISPRVAIIKYNAKFPPDCEWVMPYYIHHVWDGTDKYSASLKSLELLGRELGEGYQLVGTDINGAYAFFVRRDLTENLFQIPATAENLYNPFRVVKFAGAYPANICLKSDVEGIKGVFDYYPQDVLFLSVTGFYPPEYTEDGTFVVQWMNEEEAKLLIKPSCDNATAVYFKFTVGTDIELTVEVESCKTKVFYVEPEKDDMVHVYSLGYAVSTGDIIEVSMRVNKLWSPGEAFGSDDNRKLGVGILDVELCSIYHK